MNYTKHQVFHVVDDKHRVYPDEDIILPSLADLNSAGPDFYLPCDVTLTPGKRKLFFTDVKANLPEGTFLMLSIRSSLGIKQGLMIPNAPGIIDASYFNNEGNDGNIGVALVNTSPLTVRLKKGDRIMQGIVVNYMLDPEATILSESRNGGCGSSGK